MIFYLLPLSEAIDVFKRLGYSFDKEKLKKIMFKARREFEDYLSHHRCYARALEKRYIPHG